MPVAGSGGGGRKGGKKNPPIVVHNPVSQNSPAPTSSPAVGSSSSSSSGSGGTKSGSKVLGGGKGSATTSTSSSSSSSTNAYLASQREAQRRARQRYIEDAERLEGQEAALRRALGPKGTFRKALDSKLDNVKLILEQQLGSLEQGFGERWGSLDADARNNDIAAGDAGTGNDTNRARERASALSEVATQGGGESDALRAQLMSLRSWEANQGEIDRSHQDSARSIQNSRIDLVNDSRTAMQNVWLEADADRAQLWNDFRAQQSEVFTSLGNVRGQQAEYYGLAKEQGGGKGGKIKSRSSSSSSSTSSTSKGGRGGKGRPETGVAQDGGPFRGRFEFDTTLGRRPSPQGGQGTGNNGGTGRGANPAGASLGGKGGGRGRGRGRAGDGSLSDRMAEAERESDWAYMQASKQLGKAYDSRGLPNRLLEWGPDIPEPAQAASSQLYNARTTIKQKAPEGATLRSW